LKRMVKKAAHASLMRVHTVIERLRSVIVTRGPRRANRP
jgi:hypothetical protein